MNTDEFIAALVRRFPRGAEEIAAWTPDYRRTLQAPELDLAESLRATLARWTKAGPPRPGDIIRKRIAVGGGKHPLTLTSEALFGKPMGNGREIPDLSDDQFREWHRQNGELFLERQAAWTRMGKTAEAADKLRDARTHETIWGVLNDFLEPIRDAARGNHDERTVTPEAIAHAKAYDRAMAEGRAWPEKPAVLSHPIPLVAGEDGVYRPPSPSDAPG